MLPFIIYLYTLRIPLEIIGNVLMCHLWKDINLQMHLALKFLFYFTFLNMHIYKLKLEKGICLN